MRSRYSAYVYRLAEYLLSTWHADTRPDALPFDSSFDSSSNSPFNSPVQSPRWLGLKIIGAQMLDENHAFVEFVARFRHGGGAAQRLHERSRFVREHGRWLYVDGDIF